MDVSEANASLNIRSLRPRSALRSVPFTMLTIPTRVTISVPSQAADASIATPVFYTGWYDGTTYFFNWWSGADLLSGLASQTVCVKRDITGIAYYSAYDSRILIPYSPGDKVYAGELIGYTGMSGNANQCEHKHLHLGILFVTNDNRFNIMKKLIVIMVY